MSAFTQARIAYSWVQGDSYRLDEEINWAIGCPSGPTYNVPKGFIFDVSIPGFLTWLFSRHESKYFRAAAIHDHMLIAGWDRMTAGANFHQALKAEGVSMIPRIIMWLAVSLYRYEI